MSVRVMQAVWEHSRMSGGALVLLLAIADNAHDDGGGAYPSVDTLAKKARMTGRNVNILLKELAAAGEIAIDPGAGPRRTNVYRVLLPGLAEGMGPPTHRPAEVCAICGNPPDDWHELHRHHRIPKHEGGSDRMHNLITACEQCNQGKSDAQVPTFAEFELYRDAAGIAASWLYYEWTKLVETDHPEKAPPEKVFAEVIRHSVDYREAIEVLNTVAAEYHAGRFGPEDWPGCHHAIGLSVDDALVGYAGYLSDRFQWQLPEGEARYKAKYWEETPF